MLCPLISFKRETVCWDYFNKMFFFNICVPINMIKYEYYQTYVFFNQLYKKKTKKRFKIFVQHVIE